MPIAFTPGPGMDDLSDYCVHSNHLVHTGVNAMGPEEVRLLNTDTVSPGNGAPHWSGIC